MICYYTTTGWWRRIVHPHLFIRPQRYTHYTHSTLLKLHERPLPYPSSSYTCTITALELPVGGEASSTLTSSYRQQHYKHYSLSTLLEPHERTPTYPVLFFVCTFAKHALRVLGGESHSRSQTCAKQHHSTTLLYKHVSLWSATSLHCLVTLPAPAQLPVLVSKSYTPCNSSPNNITSTTHTSSPTRYTGYTYSTLTPLFASFRVTAHMVPCCPWQLGRVIT